MTKDGGAATDSRRAEVDAVVRAVHHLVLADERVVGAALCGSWAAGRPTMASDVDLIVVTHDRDELVADGGWARAALPAPAELVRRRRWGPHLTELRYRLGSGLEVEIGVVDAAWVSTDPVDPGTRQVVSDGVQVIYDPAHLLAGVVSGISSDDRSGEP